MSNPTLTLQLRPVLTMWAAGALMNKEAAGGRQNWLSQVAFLMAGVGQPELVWANGTKPRSEMRAASEVLPGPWKTASDVCCDGQVTNLVLICLVIPQVHGIAAHSPVKFTCWCFQMLSSSQNAWCDTHVPPGVRLNTAQTNNIPSLGQKHPLQRADR